MRLLHDALPAANTCACVSAAVCKAEWAYEVDIVFKDLDSFKGYMGSDFKANVATPAFALCVCSVAPMVRVDNQ